MNKKTIIFLKKPLGVLLIILGIIGLFLPALQGILFILAGAALLGNHKLINFIKKTRNYFRKAS